MRKKCVKEKVWKCRTALVCNPYSSSNTDRSLFLRASQKTEGELVKLISIVRLLMIPQYEARTHWTK